MLYLDYSRTEKGDPSSPQKHLFFLMSVCQQKLSAEGCLVPCEDVTLCVAVERGIDANESTNEYLYTISLQNCSSSTLVGDFSILLGAGIYCDDTLANTSIEGTYTGHSICNELGATVRTNASSPMWTGLTPTSIIVKNAHIKPGSVQFWYRFKRDVDPDNAVYLPSQVSFVGKVQDAVCKYPCKIMKCVHADGDCLTPL